MTITNDERREVAARLRDYESLRESLRESPMCAFLDALGAEGYLDWKGVCNRLADLIEPEERTCGEWRGGEYITNGGFTETYAELWCEHCDILLEEYWQYCPECGAKVVE